MTANPAEFDPGADDVFGRIAKKYDFLCDIFSLGIHRHWKSTMARRVNKETQSGTVLDIASGTGDIALRLSKFFHAQSKSATIIASDISPAMLDIARSKRDPDHRSAMEFKHLDAHDLKEIADNSIDIYAVSFAMKICDREKLLPEALRVLKPGGHFFCLEASNIPLKPVHWAYLRYMKWCVPIIATLATGGDRSAHNYLLKGIEAMPDQKRFAAELENYGFSDVRYKNLSLGIVALHSGRKGG